MEDQAAQRADAPIADSEEIPASGARVRELRPAEYPVSVVEPGVWSRSDVPEEDHGFPAPKERRPRPRLRLALSILVSVLGLLIAAATVILFVRLTEYATTTLPSTAAPVQISTQHVTAHEGAMHA